MATKREQQIQALQGMGYSIDQINSAEQAIQQGQDAKKVVQDMNNQNLPTGNQTGTANQNQTQDTVKEQKPVDNQETLQTQKFETPANNQVVVKEGTAQQTGTPDYKLNSDARMKEITDNLNYYWQNNRDYFSDRQTFNDIFHYNDRDASQQAVLDSYWKKKDLQDSTSSYTNGNSISQGINNAEITTDQLNYIKDYNPEIYAQWQEEQQKKIDQMIANMATPADPMSLSETITQLTEKLNIQAGDPYDIIKTWNDAMESTGANNSLKQLQATVDKMKAKQSEYESVMSRYANAGANTAGGAAANNARMLKALAPITESYSQLAQLYSVQNTNYQTQMATANQVASVTQAQAQEDQRIFNNKLSSLGFAMEVNSYRTPEQAAQLQLQTQAIQNDMSLLNQSKLNDLSLYNQYRTAKMQNQLNSELTDLSVKDPNQLRANLNNVLSQYYSQYGDIIKRSQSQAVDDILAYSKANGVSVAEALTKNFIEPLQNKSEYKAQVAENYGINKYQQQYSYTIDENGNVKISASGYGEIPQSAFANRQSRQDAYEGVYDYTDGNRGDYINCLVGSIKDGSYGGQCGEFVNDVLLSGGNSKIFGDTLVQKVKACNVDVEEGPKVGYAVVMDFNKRVPNKEGTANVNYGHVAIVTGVNADGSIDVIESNGDGSETIRTHTYPASVVKNNVKGYYKPANYTEPNSGLTGSDITMQQKLGNKFGNELDWNENGYIESLKTDFESYLSKGKDAITDSQWKALKEDYGITEKEFREMAQMYAKTGLKAQGVAQAEKALSSALLLQEMLTENRTLWLKDNPQGGLLDWSLLQFIPRTDAGEAKAQFKTLLSQLELNELYTAKNNGATFGAMSESEWDILGQASTNLKRNSSSETFSTNLDSLISELSNVIVSGGGTLPEGMHNTDI